MFTIGTFSAIEISNSGAPSVYAYKTLDTLAEVGAANYFDDAVPALVTGDIVLVAASDGTSTIKSNGSGGVSVSSDEIQASAYVTLSGGTPTIQKSKNISSITDRGTGSFTLNTTTDLPSINYVLSGSAGLRVGVFDDTNLSRLVGAIPIITQLDNGVATDSNFSFQVTGA